MEKIIKVQAPENKGKFNLRTITVGDLIPRTGKMYNGVTDKGRAVWVYDWEDGTVGIKDAVGHPFEASGAGWKNVYAII